MYLKWKKTNELRLLYVAMPSCCPRLALLSLPTNETRYQHSIMDCMETSLLAWYQQDLSSCARRTDLRRHRAIGIASNRGPDRSSGIGHILIDVRSNICHQIRCTERTRQASIAGKENDHVYLIGTGATVLLGISPVSLDTGPYCCKRIGFRVDAAQPKDSASKSECHISVLLACQERRQRKVRRRWQIKRGYSRSARGGNPLH